MRHPAVAAAMALAASALLAGCSPFTSETAPEPCATLVPIPFAEPEGKGLTVKQRDRLAARVVDADTVREPSVTVQTVTMVATYGEGECSTITEEINGTIDPQLVTADYTVRKVTDFRGKSLDTDTTVGVLISQGTVGYDLPDAVTGFEKSTDTVESLDVNPFGTIEWGTLFAGATAIHRVDHEPGPHGDVTYLVTVPWNVLNAANATLREGWGSGPAGSLLPRNLRNKPVTVAVTVEEDGRPVAFEMAVDTTELMGSVDPTTRYMVSTSVEWDHYGVQAIRPAPAW